jgi:hypothetical protein
MTVFRCNLVYHMMPHACMQAALTRIAELESALMAADRQQEQMQLLRAELEAKDKVGAG